MKPSIKAKWLKALRSGKYKQGKEFLKYNGHYCCLGVLCELLPASLREDTYGAGELLGRKQCAFAGLRFRTQRSLAEKNDNGWSFKKIADYIEKRIA